MTGIELTTKLLTNINTSLELRAQIPYLDMLRDLVEGGAIFSSSVLNTSSNFGSFDRYLGEILFLLNGINTHIINPGSPLPLPLTSILENLTAHADLVSSIFQKEIDDNLKSDAAGISIGGEFRYRLELISAASV